MSQESGNQAEKNEIISGAIDLREDMEGNQDMQEGADRAAKVIIRALAAGVPLSYVTLILFGHSVTL